MKLAIFDLAGTLVNFGCTVVKDSFKFTLVNNNISAPDEVIKRYTGVSKREHLRLILNDPEVYHSQSFDENNIESLYEEFVTTLLFYLKTRSDLIDGALDLYNNLKSKNVKIATNTGYFKKAADIVVEAIKEQGFIPDVTICDDDVPSGRPAPWMIFESMKAANVQSVHDVIVVGDTVVDVQAGLNSGCLTYAVTDSSSIIGLTQKQFSSLSKYDRNDLRTNALKTLTNIDKPFAKLSIIKTVKDLDRIYR